MKTELLSSRKLKPVHVMHTTVHAFHMRMHQLVTDDCVIMNPFKRFQF